MEKMINKRRAGDENIGKLIVFAITIVIAIGLVGLVSYFYTQSRQVAVNTSILGDVNSSTGDIAKVLPSCTNGSITYDAIQNTYTMSGTTCDVSTVKGIKGTSASYQIAK
jgi:hypothetical protein